MRKRMPWPDPYDPVESYWSHDPRTPGESPVRDDPRILGDPRIHIFHPPAAPPPPTELVAVLTWECPSCKHRNPYDDSLDGEVCACLACGKLARPSGASLREASTTGDLANVRKLLDW